MGTTNILDMNNRVSELEKAVSGVDSVQANKSDIATEFSTTTSYTAGCFVYYGGKLYQFNADHSAGAWDPTDVVEANVTDQVVSNKSAIDGLTASALGTSIALTANTPITVTSDGYVVYGCGATSGDYCYLYINDVNVAHATYASNLSALPYSCLFVKKGMTIKFEGVNAAAIFYPLT